MLNAGDRLRCVPGPVGCRLYIAAIPAGETQQSAPFRSQSGAWDWVAEDDALRVLEGPEPDGLTHALSSPWRLRVDSNEMGIRLAPASGSQQIPQVDFDIESSPTQDGVLQLTPDGLIALMRHRGTLGGYPRIATIVGPDIDRMAQMQPGQMVRFRLVDMATAAAAHDLQQQTFQRLTGYSMTGLGW
ncbi:MAG: hypothetical protein AAFP69_23090, partial [Planctomycetota bacterium]